jgi:hypothetical protein
VYAQHSDYSAISRSYVNVKPQLQSQLYKSVYAILEECMMKLCLSVGVWILFMSIMQVHTLDNIHGIDVRTPGAMLVAYSYSSVIRNKRLLHRYCYIQSYVILQYIGNFCVSVCVCPSMCSVFLNISSPNLVGQLYGS